ncbi:MAG: AraC family transcriptional regulator [Polyangiaceae bacterium]|nr:AraC family transcriptional regulator [Polyangiaceae bacterium]
MPLAEKSGPVPHQDTELTNRYMVGLRSFPLTAFPVENHPAISLHRHGDYAELVLVTGGRGEHLLERQSFPIRRGDIFMVPVKTIHGYAECEDLGLINVMFDPARLPLPDQMLRQMPGYRALFEVEPYARARQGFRGRLHVDDATLTNFCATLARLEAEVLNRRSGFQAASTALLVEVLVGTARCYEDMASKLPQSLVRLSALLEWLDRHFAETITIETLVARAHMSRSALGRCFQDCFELSPMGYVTELRLRKAEFLLCDTDAQIREVAARVGIDDANYFARMFRKNTGFEPSLFRARHRKALKTTGHHGDPGGSMPTVERRTLWAKSANPRA